MNVYWHNGPFFRGRGTTWKNVTSRGIIPLVEFFFYKFYTWLFARLRPVWYTVIRIRERVIKMRIVFANALQDKKMPAAAQDVALYSEWERIQNEKGKN